MLDVSTATVRQAIAAFPEGLEKSEFPIRGKGYWYDITKNKIDTAILTKTVPDEVVPDEVVYIATSVIPTYFGDVKRFPTGRVNKATPDKIARQLFDMTDVAKQLLEDFAYKYDACREMSIRFIDKKSGYVPKKEYEELVNNMQQLLPMIDLYQAVMFEVLSDPNIINMEYWKVVYPKESGE
jgi:hypothetical protein